MPGSTSIPTSFAIFGAAITLLALAYIVRLRRDLAAARQRGDMYRDIAASLDRERATP